MAFFLFRTNIDWTHVVDHFGVCGCGFICGWESFMERYRTAVTRKKSKFVDNVMNAVVRSWFRIHAYVQNHTVLTF